MTSPLRTSRRRDPRRDVDRGFSLPELIITMALLGMITALVLALFSTYARTITRERSATDSTNIASIGMEEMTRVLRSGTSIRRPGDDLMTPAFLVADNERFIVHAFLDTSSASPRPVKVQMAVDADRDLIETRWSANAASGPYWTFQTNPVSTRRIAGWIAPRAAGERYLFTYRTEVVCAPAAPDCNVLVVPTGGITDQAVLARISLVEVRLRVQADITQRANPVTMTNQVGLPNLGIDRVGASK